MAKRSNEYHIGAALDAFLEERGLLEAALARRVIANWKNIVGPAIADQTSAVWYQNRAFHLELKTPAWKHELAYTKSNLLKLINDYAGRTLADDIVVK